MNAIYFPVVVLSTIALESLFPETTSAETLLPPGATVTGSVRTIGPTEIYDDNAAAEARLVDSKIGRDGKYEDAEGKAKSAKIEALNMGMQYTSQGMALMANPFTIPQGIELLTKAGLEFWQNDSDRKSQHKNGDAKDELRATAGQNGTQNAATTTSCRSPAAS